METIQDFSAWLDPLELTGHEDVHSLYMAVVNVEGWGPFEAKPTKNGKGIVVYADYIQENLLLSSDKAINAFKKEIEKRYVDSDMDIEAWYQYRRAMAKDD